MSILRRAVLPLLAAILTVPLFASAAFANANPQDHCSGSVCVGAESVGGHGPDILNAQVETKGQIHVPIHTVLYLLYGANPTVAKKAIPRYCIAETTILYGCNFGIGKTLTPGYVFCGEISGYVGYPCITIGKE